MAKIKPSTVVGLVALAGAAGLAAWLLGGPDPPLVVPPLHPPHPVHAPALARADGGGAPEDEPPADDPPPAANTPHDGPSRFDLEAALARVKPHLARCQSVERFVGLMTVKLAIARSGNVQSVTVLQPPEKTLTAECVVKAIKAGSFPRFRGEINPTIEWTCPLLFREGGLL